MPLRLPLGPVYTSVAERRDATHCGHIDRATRSINLASIHSITSHGNGSINGVKDRKLRKLHYQLYLLVIGKEKRKTKRLFRRFLTALLKSGALKDKSGIWDQHRIR